MKVRTSAEFVVLFLNTSGSYQGCIHQDIILKKCYSGGVYLCYRSHKRNASSTASNHAGTAQITAEKATSVIPKDLSAGMGTQIRTVNSLLMEMVKTTTPAVTSSILRWAKTIPFMNEATGATKAEMTVEEEIAKKAAQDSLFASKSETQPTEKVKVIPKWKVKRKSAITQESIDSRTKYVIHAVAKASSSLSLHKRIDDFCNHLFQYPAAKSLAAREGAVSVLLRLRNSITNDDHAQQQIREGLALLGYSDPLPTSGIRILTIDGGGTRGLLALRILRHLEETVGRPIYESFDYICGVSTGAVLALLIGASKKSISEIEIMYREISSEVFRRDRSSGLGGLLWNHSYYSTEKWEQILKEKIGEIPMIETSRDPQALKVGAVSSIVNHATVRPYVFRNYTLPFRSQSLYSGSFRHKMWEAVRASSAAPGYFGEFKLEDKIHQDGGLFVNNPTAVAIHEAKCIWPNAKLSSVVSIGTGRCQPLDLTSDDGNGSNSTTWKQKLSKVIDSATDTERVHTVLHDLLPPKVYYRFNPYLSEVHGLDETDPLRWSHMLDDVDMYIRKNQFKIDQAATTLNKPCTYHQLLNNWLVEKRFLLENRIA